MTKLFETVRDLFLGVLIVIVAAVMLAVDWVVRKVGGP